MEQSLTDEELARLEEAPPEERIAALEEHERRLRAALDDTESV